MDDDLTVNLAGGMVSLGDLFDGGIHFRDDPTDFTACGILGTVGLTHSSWDQVTCAPCLATQVPTDRSPAAVQAWLDA